MKGTTIDHLLEGQCLVVRDDSPAVEAGAALSACYRVRDVHRPTEGDYRGVVEAEDVAGERILELPESWVSSNLQTSTGQPIEAREPIAAD